MYGRTTIHARPLPLYLMRIQEEMEGYAKGFGLDFFKTHFEILSYEEMNAVAAYGGFPNRYPHWRFGMEYERLFKSHTYGLAKIYEMVINNDPCVAYLLEGNSLVEQKLVIAHVLAHCDFFRQNLWFAPTNRRMMDEMANHGDRMREYMERHGVDPVEEFIDVALSLDNLIDPHAPYKPKAPRKAETDRPEPGVEVPRLKAKPYMDSYINPPEYLEAQKKRLVDESNKDERFPPRPERDVLSFLAENAPLQNWEHGVLDIVREEAYYFAPQAMTKIMNEGWATYWHSRIMTEKALDSSEIIEYADRTSGVTATSGFQLNPYKLGVELWRNIKDRWDKGQYGKEWEECDDLSDRHCWNRKTGIGNQKLFEVRRVYNDVTFIDEFLTLDFAVENKLFTFGYNQRRGQWEILSREFREIKRQLLLSLTNLGNPFIAVEDANFGNRGELLLKHDHQGVDLREDWARATLQNLFRVWKRPVNLLTLQEKKPVTLRYDGKEHSGSAA